MAPTRRKAAAQQAPQTIEEATGLLGRYAALITAVEERRAAADTAIANIEAIRDAVIAPVEEEAKALFLQLRAWWSVAGDTLTEGKRKSYELAGCVLGERTTPPSLSLVKLKAAEAVDLLLAERLNNYQDGRWQGLIRTKHELDKPAILVALQLDGIGARLLELGFKAKQKQEFFIDRAAPKPATVEEVQEAAE